MSTKPELGIKDPYALDDEQFQAAVDLLKEQRKNITTYWSAVGAQVDAFTILFVIFYLAVLVAGGISATNYAIVYKQTNYTAWAPLLWPVKVVMTIGIFLMLLQCVSNFFKDIAIARGKPIA